MKTTITLIIIVLLFSLFSFTKSQNEGVKKIGENLYEVSFKTKSMDEAKKHELYKLISKNYNLQDLESRKVDFVDLNMIPGKSGPNWVIDKRISPLFVSSKVINYDNSQSSSTIENSFNGEEIINLLEKYN